MNLSVLLLAIFLSFSAVSTTYGSCPASVKLATGSYTYQSWLPKGKGEGVTILSLTDSALTKVVLFSNVTVTGQNPSYCQLSVLSHGVIYCTRSVAGGSGVTRWHHDHIDPSGPPPPTMESGTGKNGGGASHIQVIERGNRDGERLITSNYGDSSVSSLLYKSGLMTVQDVDVIPRHYASRNPADGYHQQNSPHPHFAFPLNNDYFLVSDLGADRVWLYKVRWNGKLRRFSGLAMRKGDGPRHLAKGTGRNIYVVNELSNTIARINGCARGFLQRECERMALLPGGQSKEQDPASSSSAAIRVSADGKYLYASIRPKDAYGAIAVFALADDGAIVRRVGVYSTHGEHPRDFNIVENGPGCKSYVVVANMNSDSIVVMERNKSTGAITDIKPQRSITVGTPTVVVNL